ncbi:MAG: hypothetical protein RL684_3289 [Pseudomonadota bacterium]|jgi:hypothetical protein
MHRWLQNTAARLYAWRALPVIALTALAMACGGGYGGGSSYTTGSSTPAGVSVGAVTGFGSVHVNGRKFETTGTSISIDDVAGTQADLHVGDVIEVKGHHDAATGKDVAEQIRMHSNVQGPLQSLDAATLTLVVMGQTVLVSAGTSFGDGISPASVSALAVGDILRVSGMPAADGSIQATRIERKPAGSALQVIGKASGVDATARTLHINALLVDFGTAALSGFTAGGPVDGDLVKAGGSALDAAGTLPATRLELRTGQELRGDAQGESEIEGLVTRFVSPTDFDIGGRAATTNAGTTFSGGTAADLALDVRVEAEGSVDASGTLVAARLKMEREADTRLLAQVDAVDATAGTVTLLGVTVSVTAMTRFEDHGPMHVNTFSLADVHNGDWLEVRGMESPAGSNAVVAERLERREAAGAVLLAGVVEAAAEPQFMLLAVPVDTLPTTVFTDSQGHSTDAATFFAGLVGQPVLVTGSWNGSSLTATAASLAGTEGEEDSGHH